MSVDEMEENNAASFWSLRMRNVKPVLKGLRIGPLFQGLRLAARDIEPHAQLSIPYALKYMKRGKEGQGRMSSIPYICFKRLWDFELVSRENPILKRLSTATQVVF